MCMLVVVKSEDPCVKGQPVEAHTNMVYVFKDMQGHTSMELLDEFPPL